jgi:hypothetical protein
MSCQFVSENSMTQGYQYDVVGTARSSFEHVSFIHHVDTF